MKRKEAVGIVEQIAKGILCSEGKEDSIMAILRPSGAGEIYSDNPYLNKHCKIRR